MRLARSQRGPWVRRLLAIFVVGSAVVPSESLAAEPPQFDAPEVRQLKPSDFWPLVPGYTPASNEFEERRYEGNRAALKKTILKSYYAFVGALDVYLKPYDFKGEYFPIEIADGVSGAIVGGDQSVGFTRPKFDIIFEQDGVLVGSWKCKPLVARLYIPPAAAEAFLQRHQAKGLFAVAADGFRVSIMYTATRGVRHRRTKNFAIEAKPVRLQINQLTDDGATTRIFKCEKHGATWQCR